MEEFSTMKKQILISIFGIFFNFIFFMTDVSAQYTSNVKPTPTKFLQITIKSIKVWGTKKNGRCWDPCLGKRYKLPKRGKKNYSFYLKNKAFKQACTGVKAPDILASIAIGKYEKFTSRKLDNRCQASFNITHTFRVSASDDFRIGIYDSDDIAGFPFKFDTIGVWQASVIPLKLFNGGTFILRHFGQVEEMVLTSKVLKPPTSNKCEGVYKIRIVEFDVKTTKENGQTWDHGIGKFKNPDVNITLKIGKHTLETPTQLNSFHKIFLKTGTILPIKKGSEVFLNVYDKDSLGKSDLIGQTAVLNVCQIINQKGIYTFPPFGQVKKVVVIFEKKK